MTAEDTEAGEGEGQRLLLSLPHPLQTTLCTGARTMTVMFTYTDVSLLQGFSLTF